MASFQGSKLLLCMALALAFCMQRALGGITCEHLHNNVCAFAVSSQGTRCVLEKRMRRGKHEELYCRTLDDIKSAHATDYIETDECIEACGVDRKTVGISSDSLSEPRFTRKLCSPRCYEVCANIVDLYFNLAAGEGLFLPKVCAAANRYQTGSNISSMGPAAGPVTAVAPESGSGDIACAPTQSEGTAFAPAPDVL